VAGNSILPFFFFANARGEYLARHVFTMTKKKVQAGVLKGWKEIAQFLGQPSSTAQRWAREGMPVEHSGRVVQAYPDQLNLWLDVRRTSRFRLQPKQVIFLANCDADWHTYVTTASDAGRLKFDSIEVHRENALMRR